MPSVKVMDRYEASSSALHLNPEKWTNQVGESDKVIISNSWQYFTEFILDDIRYPEGGAQNKYLPSQNYTCGRNNPCASTQGGDRKKHDRLIYKSQPKRRAQQLSRQYPKYGAIPIY